MNQEELHHRLFSDAREIKLPVEEIELIIKPYSKTYYGRYYPSAIEEIQPCRIILYQYEDENCTKELDYEILISTFIHEMVHHIQYVDPSHKRMKGVMHDEQFWKLHNRYISKLEQLNGGETEDDEEVCIHLQ